MKCVFAMLVVALGGTAHAGDWPPAGDYLFIARDCATSDDPGWCSDAKTLWEKDYNGAIHGDYQGQRNVSFCLSTGCEPLYHKSLRTNPVLACAWRFVILRSGHLQADVTDTTNAEHFCGPEYIDDLGRRTAEAQASRMLKMLGVR